MSGKVGVLTSAPLCFAVPQGGGHHDHVVPTVDDFLDVIRKSSKLSRQSARMRFNPSRP